MSGAHGESRDVGLRAVGDADDTAEQRVFTDARADIGLHTARHQRVAGQAGGVAGQRRGGGAGEHDIGESLGGVGAVERVVEIAVGVRGGDEHGDAHRDDHDDRRELAPLAPHIAAQLAAQDVAHQSSSSASTGAATSSEPATRPERRRTTRSAIRAIAELWVTSNTV